MSALEFFAGFITISDDPVRNCVLEAILLSVSGSVAYAISGRSYGSLHCLGEYGRLWAVLL